MPIQVERATNSILHELGQGGMRTGMTELEVVEMAYAKLFAAHEGWYWALKTTHLDTVAASNIIRLPNDWHNIFQPAQWDEGIRILRDAEYYQLQAAEATHVQGLFLARLGEDDTGWFLEFMEPFEEVETEKFRVTYESGPVEITDGTQTLPLPRRMHLVFLSLCRAIAKGFEESDETSVEAECAWILRSETFDDAVMADIRMRPPSIDRGARRISRLPSFGIAEAVLPIISPNGTEIWPN